MDTAFQKVVHDFADEDKSFKAQSVCGGMSFSHEPLLLKVEKTRFVQRYANYVTMRSVSNSMHQSFG